LYIVSGIKEDSNVYCMRLMYGERGYEKDTPNIIWKFSKENRIRKIWLLMEGEC
jgi:hypothetical protein